MLAPPLELGAVNAMLALALPAVAAPIVGAPGTVALVPELAVMLYFCTLVVPLVGVVLGHAPEVAAERWIKPA